MLAPVLALIAWTLFVIVWVYAARISAMFGLGLSPVDFKTPEGLDKLPPEVNAIATNYGQLTQQPVLFYALCLAIHVGPFTDDVFRVLAWIYVVLRVVHTLIQATSNHVIMRFLIFVCTTLVLVVMTWRTWLALAAQ